MRSKFHRFSVCTMIRNISWRITIQVWLDELNKIQTQIFRSLGLSSQGSRQDKRCVLSIISWSLSTYGLYWFLLLKWSKKYDISTNNNCVLDDIFIIQCVHTPFSFLCAFAKVRGELFYKNRARLINPPFVVSTNFHLWSWLVSTSGILNCITIRRFYTQNNLKIISK